MYSVGRVAAVISACSLRLCAASEATSGLVLLQRQVEGLDANADENVTKPAEPEVETMSLRMKALDDQLQRKAKQHSDHVEAMVAEFNAELKVEKAKVHVLAKANKHLQSRIHAQRQKNRGNRAKLNTTKQAIADVAHALLDISTDLSHFGRDLDAIAKKPAPPHASVLQVANHPDGELDNVTSSLDKIHEELEREVTDNFHQEYATIRAREEALTKRQQGLNRTLASEIQEGAALEAEIAHMRSLLGRLSDKVHSLGIRTSDLGQVVKGTKSESAQQQQLMANMSHEKLANSTTHRPSQLHNQSARGADHVAASQGFFGRAKEALKMATASVAAGVHHIFSRQTVAGSVVNATSAVKANMTHVANGSRKPRAAPSQSLNASSQKHASKATNASVAKKSAPRANDVVEKPRTTPRAESHHKTARPAKVLESKVGQPDHGSDAVEHTPSRAAK